MPILFPKEGPQRVSTAFVARANRKSLLDPRDGYVLSHKKYAKHRFLTQNCARPSQNRVKLAMGDLFRKFTSPWLARVAKYMCTFQVTVSANVCEAIFEHRESTINAHKVTFTFNGREHPA